MTALTDLIQRMPHPWHKHLDPVKSKVSSSIKEAVLSAWSPKASDKSFKKMLNSYSLPKRLPSTVRRRPRTHKEFARFF